MTHTLTMGLYPASGTGGEISDLAGAFDVQVRIAKDGSGVGTFTLHNDHADYAEVVEGRIVRWFIDGTPVWQMRLRGPEWRSKTSIGSGGDAAKVTVFRGQDLLGDWDDFVVYPEGGVNNVASDVPDGLDDREWDWGSYLFVEDASWVAATERFTVGDPASPPAAWAGKPAGVPSELAGGIVVASRPLSGSADPTGTWLLRNEVAFLDGHYAIFYAANDQFELRFDGIRLDAFTESGPGGWETVRRRDLIVAAGNHLIGMAVTNVAVPGAATAITGAFIGVLPVNDDGSFGTALVFTDSTWDVYDYPATLPGITPGRILRYLLEEAQERGLMTGWTLSCTDSDDSDGDPFDAVPVTMQVGMAGRAALEQLGEGQIDYRVDESTLTLHVYVKGGHGTASGVTIDPTKLEQLTYTEST